MVTRTHSFDFNFYLIARAAPPDRTSRATHATTRHGRAGGGGAARDDLDATDLADLLVKRGVPFREAHDRVGAAVNAAIEEGVPLERLSSDARAATMPELDGVDLAGELGTDALLARRDVIGGTAAARVAAEVDRWKGILAGTDS